MATQENRSMVSETSICNQALLWCGSKAITSLDDNSREARWMKQNYPFIRDAVIESTMWTFATVRAMSTVADRDAWDQRYVHPIPATWLSVLRCYRNVEGNDSSQWDPAGSWSLEGRQVLSEYSTIYMYGVERVTDTGIFSPTFVQALAARIAADAAIPLTENRLLQRELWILYNNKLLEAQAQDGKQGKMERLRARRFVRSR